MEALRRISPVKQKKPKKKVPPRGADLAGDAQNPHMGSVVMALLSSQAGDDLQAVKHLNESRMHESESEITDQAKLTVHDRLAAPPRGEIRLARASDFIFDGQIHKSASLGSGIELPNGDVDIDPARQFIGKHDTLCLLYTSPSPRD